MRAKRSDELLIVQTCQYTMIQFNYAWLLNFYPKTTLLPSTGLRWHGNSDLKIIFMPHFFSHRLSSVTKFWNSSIGKYKLVVSMLPYPSLRMSKILYKVAADGHWINCWNRLNVAVGKKPVWTLLFRLIRTIETLHWPCDSKVPFSFTLYFIATCRRFIISRCMTRLEQSANSRQKIE